MNDKATKQAKGVSPISGVAPPKHTQFGAENGNPRNNGGIPKYVREIREELKGLLDPNLTMEDYQQIADSAATDRGLRGLFAEAVVHKDTKTVIELINQAWGKAKESVDVTTQGESINPYAALTTEELRKLAGKG